MILLVMSILTFIVSIWLAYRNSDKFDVFAGIFGMIYSLIGMAVWIIEEFVKSIGG